MEGTYSRCPEVRVLGNNHKSFSIRVGSSWDLVAHPVTQVIGEQALVDILDLSEVAWTCWGCFYTQQWAGAEDGEGIRPTAGTGNE